MTMQRVRAWDLVGRARNVGCVVVAVAWLMMTVCEDSQVRLGVRRHQLRFRAGVVQSLFARVELEFRALLRRSAQALST